jgi:septal ring factor EnvC (AmiA/AmiB activator)
MLKVLKNQVTEVKDAMKDNVETLHEREGNLEDLESRATELEEQTVSNFYLVDTRINILQWILVKLGTYLVLKRIWNPIDFQGHRSKVKVTGSIF